MMFFSRQIQHEMVAWLKIFWFLFSLKHHSVFSSVVLVYDVLVACTKH